MSSAGTIAQFRLIDIGTRLPELNMPSARLYFTLAEATAFLEASRDRPPQLAPD